jgi:hypothetical protein
MEDYFQDQIFDAEYQDYLYQKKQQIDELVENFEPQLNQLEFRRMSMQDGFGVVDFSSLMTCFKKIVANNTT